MHKISSTPPGQIYVIATPIGNLSDLSLRAIETLKAVDVIVAEDTRHSQHLLQHYAIHNACTSLHSHNEGSKSKQLLAELLAGKSLAIISDAGTPLISDPGFPLIRMAQEEGIQVIPIPGCCALIAALSASGVPCQSFFFAGFLAQKSSARREQLRHYLGFGQTTVLYESPHRLHDCIADIAEVYGQDYAFVLAKELTKTHERFIKGCASELSSWLAEDPYHGRGEFVIILPAQTQEAREAHIPLRLLTILLAELPLKQAVKIAAAISGEARNILYPIALRLQQNQEN
ncbi:MAG: 16S rRNA (cytidine(1402)-2'-O)-methyltransferase [Legionellaceae bacterium]|nr:16S rRNA (cytidine(1402)-2'-O)-methyltransferase [Legionellaceae bacterium]